MKKIFNNAFQTFTDHFAKPAVKYLATPIGKITLFNLFLFVFINLCSLSGKSKVFHRVSFKNTSPLKDKTSKITDFTQQ